MANIAHVGNNQKKLGNNATWNADNQGNQNGIYANKSENGNWNGNYNNREGYGSSRGGYVGQSPGRGC